MTKMSNMSLYSKERKSRDAEKSRLRDRETHKTEGNEDIVGTDPFPDKDTAVETSTHGEGAQGEDQGREDCLRRSSGRGIHVVRRRP